MLPSNRNLPPGRPGNSSGWIFAGPWANLGDMKSAYELAMERLSKTAPASKLTQAQKAELAELDSIYAAKLAQADLSTREALQAAPEDRKSVV